MFQIEVLATESTSSAALPSISQPLTNQIHNRATDQLTDQSVGACPSAPTHSTFRVPSIFLPPTYAAPCNPANRPSHVDHGRTTYPRPLQLAAPLTGFFLITLQCFPFFICLSIASLLVKVSGQTEHRWMLTGSWACVVAA